MASSPSAATATAGGSREVPQPRSEVWRALAVLEPYCAVCDVSYVLAETGRNQGVGTTFVCAPGRLDWNRPAPGAPRAQIVAWEPERLVVTRLELTPETWTTQVELADTADGGTRVSITISHEPTRGSRLVRRLQRNGLRRLVQRTVDAELAKVPAHVAGVRGTG